MSQSVWLVVQYWPGGARKIASAHLDEDAARSSAARFVGMEGALITLESAPIYDADGCETGD